MEIRDARCPPLTVASGISLFLGASHPGFEGHQLIVDFEIGERLLEPRESRFAGKCGQLVLSVSDGSHPTGLVATSIKVIQSISSCAGSVDS